MSLIDTREIATAKIVMVSGGGGGGGSDVEGNPAGSATNYLSKIKINNSIYDTTGIIPFDVSLINNSDIHISAVNAGQLDGKTILINTTTHTGTTPAGWFLKINQSTSYEMITPEGRSFKDAMTDNMAMIVRLDASQAEATVLGVLGSERPSDVVSGLGIGKKTSVSNNVIITDIDLHRAPMVGDRLLIWFDATVQNPTGLTTYNNGTAVTSGLENVTPMYINAGWNILKYENSFLGTGWVRVQNVPIPNNTLSGLTDTAIVSPSDGQMLAYDNSSSKWKNKTLQPNASGTAVRELKTLQIGDNVFDTFGLKTFDVSSVTSGVSGAIAVSVITASQLNGEIIAVHTGSNSGTTSNAWTLALNDGQTIEALTMSKGGSAYTDAITANCLLFVKCDITNSTATLLGIAGAGTTVQANPSGSPTTELNKLKIGNGVYDTSAIKPHTISSISSGSMTVHVTNLDQLNGKVIAICTESNTGTTSLAWELNLSDGGSSAGISMTNADGTDFTDEITANELLFVYVDADNFVATVLGIAGAGSDDEIKTATGNPITLTDAIAGNAIEVSAEIVASQDLHGYDKPWVGGAGINILPLTLTNLKAINTEGVWADNIYTDNGGTVTVETSGDNVIGITLNGTFTATTFFYLATSILLSSTGNYYLSGCPSGGGDNYRIDVRGGAEGTVHDDGAGVGFTVSDTSTTRYSIIRIGAGTINNRVFRPQLEKGTAATPYATWSNICPITGFSSVTITDVDAEGQTATVTVQLGQTVYGGTLDLTSGELTVTHAILSENDLSSFNIGPSAGGLSLAQFNVSAVMGADIYCNMFEQKDGSSGYNSTTFCVGATNEGAQIRVYSDATSSSDFKTKYAGLQVVYTLATPTTLTLTPTQLALVKGYNQLTCNSGDMEITYKASGLDALKERVDELEDAVEDIETDMASKTDNSVVGTVENGTTASQAYAVGEHFIRNDAFCTAIAAIASGATLTLNTNYVEGTIAEALNGLSGGLSVTTYTVTVAPSDYAGMGNAQFQFAYKIITVSNMSNKKVFVTAIGQTETNVVSGYSMVDNTHIRMTFARGSVPETSITYNVNVLMI